MPRDAVRLLAKTELMAGVPEEHLRRLDPAPDWLSIAAGDTLIEQGRPGESFYLLVYGRLRVFVTAPNGTPRRVGEVLPGEGVGEMALLTDEATAASVRAMHDCELIRFSRDSFRQLVESSPEAALRVTRTVIKRLRTGLVGDSRKLLHSTIAVVPAGAGVDIAAFVETLSEQLSVFGATLVVAPDSLGAERAELLRSGRPLEVDERRAIRAALKAAENISDIVVFATDPTPTEWTRLCLNQAHVVLAVASLDDGPELSETEAALINRGDPDLAPRHELVLLHPDRWRTNCGTSRWLAPRNPSDFHHVRTGVEEDFARLARILTGNAINLVLGGGGARGFAQIGALKALAEAGVPIDRIGGTSMGSLVGALHAMGKSFDEIKRINREIWIEGKPLSDYTFPAIAIVRGRRLHNLVKNALAGWAIEDLSIRFFCVSGNLTSTDLMLHDHGALWEGVRASGSIPGAGPPLFLRGQVLVDGGVLNNLPGDIMQEKYTGAVIAVDVNPKQTMDVPDDYHEVPSGWSVLWSRINPFAKPLKVPSIFEILYRTATLSSDRLAKRTHERTDLLLTPEVGQFGVLDFEALDQIVDIGYRSTTAAIAGELDPRIARYAHPKRKPPVAPASRSEKAAETPKPTASQIWQGPNAGGLAASAKLKQES